MYISVQNINYEAIQLAPKENKLAKNGIFYIKIAVLAILFFEMSPITIPGKLL